MVATGYNDDGQCYVSYWTDIVQVEAGLRHTIGLKKDGTVVATGYNKNDQCDVYDWTDIIQISTSSTLTLGLKADGTVVHAGQLDNPAIDVSQWSDMAIVATGSCDAIGVRSNGSGLGFENDACAVTAYGEMMASVHYDGTLSLTGTFKGSILDTLKTWSGIRVVGADGNNIPGTAPGGKCTRPAVPQKPDSASLTDSGQCGDNLTWEYYEAEKLLFISGEGDMWDYEENAVPWAYYLPTDNNMNRKTHTVVVEPGVTSIGNNAFSVEIPDDDALSAPGFYAYKNSRIVRVFLPDGLTRIGNSAFYESDNLRWCPLPDTVTEIGKNAFNQCEYWSSDIPRSLTTLGERAFMSSGIQVAHLPETLRVVPSMAFAECEHLQVVDMTDGTVEIGSECFSSCPSLKRVTLPQTLNTIGTNAFIDCDSLVRIILPSSLMELQNHAFASCDNLETVHIPGAVSNINKKAFAKCNRLSKITSDVADAAAQVWAAELGITFEVVEG